MYVLKMIREPAGPSPLTARLAHSARVGILRLNVSEAARAMRAASSLRHRQAKSERSGPAAPPLPQTCCERRPGSSVVERGPEKAGVGGSIPSLATTLQRTYGIRSEKRELQLPSLHNLAHRERREREGDSGTVKTPSRRGHVGLYAKAVTQTKRQAQFRRAQQTGNCGLNLWALEGSKVKTLRRELPSSYGD